MTFNKKTKKLIITITSIFAVVLLIMYHILDNKDTFNNLTFDTNSRIEVNQEGIKNICKEYTPVLTQSKESKEQRLENIEKKIICEDILANNPKISRETAYAWTERIYFNYKVRYKKSYTALLQASLIGSESNWIPNPKHINKQDRGMTGTNIEYWADELKEAGIIKSVKDLENPLISIDACSYILNKYMIQYNKKPVLALAGYKGFHKTGMKRAQIVFNNAKKLRYKVNKELNS